MFLTGNLILSMVKLVAPLRGGLPWLGRSATRGVSPRIKNKSTSAAQRVFPPLREWIKQVFLPTPWVVGYVFIPQAGKYEYSRNIIGPFYSGYTSPPYLIACLIHDTHVFLSVRAEIVFLLWGRNMGRCHAISTVQISGWNRAQWSKICYRSILRRNSVQTQWVTEIWFQESPLSSCK